MSKVPDDLVPELGLELPPFPSHLITVRSGPPRPHVSTPPPAPTGSDANQSLSIAERNLESVRGKNLNAAQSDLVSKVRGFIKDAREAAQIADWSRARSLAKKAQVLSDELAGSL